MIAHGRDTDLKAARRGDCGCGCGGQCGCASRCCDLECLVRPSFFCGQLLTDADLGAMVDWTRNRLALARYRHGWGVICGLDVTCSHPGGGHDCCPDPQGGPTVYVNPGYALDCCGNDLVVCEPLAVDLGRICRPIEDPCDPKITTDRQEDAGRRRSDDVNVDGVREEGGDREDCWPTLREGLFALNLSLRYHEDLAQGQRAMLRSGCSDGGSCEYARVQERPCVHVELAAADCGEDEAWKRWDEDFGRRRVRARSEIDKTVGQGADAVLRYLRAHPPYKFCFLEELVCCFWALQAPNEQTNGHRRLPETPAWSGRVPFWLYLDWLLRELECSCWSCRPDSGVPLARVLLKRVKGRGATTCRVLLIDTSVPHRRPLHKDPCRPIPPGAIDLAPYLWQPAGYATERLGAAGVRVIGPSVRSEADALEAVDRGKLWLGPGEERTLYAWAVRDPFDCERVVAFDTSD
jgi:hypothetical protein